MLPGGGLLRPVHLYRRGLRMRAAAQILATVPAELLEAFRLDERPRQSLQEPVLVDFTCAQPKCRASWALRWPWQSYQLRRLFNHAAEHAEQLRLPGVR